MSITKAEYIAAVAELARSVWDFHERFEVPFTTGYDIRRILVERLPLLDEEVGEHARELNRLAPLAAVSEMSDVTYIALGTLLVADHLGLKAMEGNVQKCDAKVPENYAARDGSGKVLPK